MEFSRCFRCMEITRGFPCPHCGYEARQERPKEYVLRPGTILNGKYVVGTLLGQGGFGITYIGWDLLLDSKVAIKEYFPAGQVGRGADGTLQWYSTPTAEAARDLGKEMFLKEARKMSRVREITQVVHIRDLFQQNETAYIVMDFVEGQTLKACLDKTGPLSWEQARAVFFPAIRAMEGVHKEGLIHRDLSPDNLMLLPDGTVKILDLGAAKDMKVNSGASSMQVAKGGFSPLEQYTQRGGSGPWSDVYAMAATMYYSLTGVLPPASVDRVETDTIRWDLPALTALPKPVLEALKKATAVFVKDRTQTMGEFLSQLEKGQTKQKRKPAKKGKKKRSPLPAIAAVLAMALVAGWTLYPKQEAEPQLESQPQTETQTEAPPETETTVPTESESIFPLSIQEQTIAVGREHIVAVCNDGSVVTKGSNAYGQCNVSNWTDIVAVSARHDYTVGLKADGTVVATGLNDQGQCNVSDWTDIVAISAGYFHTIGLKADGTVVATGENYDGQWDVSDWTDIVAIVAGFPHAVGLKADGTVVATGNNRYGQCDVSDWTDIVAISASQYHTVGLKTDGTVVATGWAYGDRCNVSDWTNIIAISTGPDVTVGLKSDGTVIATGYSYDFSTWSDVIAITTENLGSANLSSNDTIAGLKADGTLLVTWDRYDTSDWTDIRIPGTTQTPKSPAPAGAGSSESTEPESIFPLSMPKPASTFPLAMQQQTISAGGGHTVAIKQDGTLVAVGHNGAGQLDISDWNDIVSIYALGGHTIGLKADGTAVAKGNGNNGQLAVSDWYWKDLVAICGSYNTVGLKSDGTAVATGAFGDSVSYYFDSIVAICSANRYLVGLRADGSLRFKTTELNVSIPNVSDWTDIVAICCGDDHIVGLKADGTVVAAGDNSGGQCDVSDWENIVAISTGTYHTVGLKADGTVVATDNPQIVRENGYSFDCGQCDVSDWTDIVAISAGDRHTIGLKADGTMVATGDNTYGQCNVSHWTDIRIPGSVA